MILIFMLLVKKIIKAVQVLKNLDLHGIIIINIKMINLSHR